MSLLHGKRNGRTEKALVIRLGRIYHDDRKIDIIEDIAVQGKIEIKRASM